MFLKKPYKRSPFKFAISGAILITGVVAPIVLIAIFGDNKEVELDTTYFVVEELSTGTIWTSEDKVDRYNNGVYSFVDMETGERIWTDSKLIVTEKQKGT